MHIAIGILLAEASGNTGDTVSVLERILQGGVPLICLAVAVVCGIGFYWQLKQNKKQSEDTLTKTEENAAARIKEQGDLLREMLDRDREAQEAQSAATAAVEGFIRALQDHTHIEEENRRILHDLLDRVQACPARRKSV